MKARERVLILSNLQRDFMPNGALKVSGANQIIPVINQILPKFEHAVLIRDWHPSNHVSFAKTHSKEPGETIQIGEISQVLRPVHCVQDTPGAEIVKGLNQTKIEAVFHKGMDPNLDSYSAFFDAYRRHSTGLLDYLTYWNLKDLFFAGIATEYAVLNSVIDAIDLGFIPSVVSDACCSLHSVEEGNRALEKMQELGAKIYLSKDL